jgi:hypothetical protein
MGYTTFHDVSEFQGAYNMAINHDAVIALRMSFAYYGSKKLALDAQAATNYRNAIRYNKIPLLYHFAGGGNPVGEADYFIGAVSPLAAGDIYVLDYELTTAMNPPANPVNWCLQFVERVHQRTGVWPILYTYASMLAEHDFTPVLRLCSLWVADYGVPPTGTVPTNGHPYIIHQFTDAPLDTNALFITLSTLRKYAYGYKPLIAPKPASSVPTPVPAPLNPDPTPASPPSPPSPQTDPAPTPQPPTETLPDLPPIPPEETPVIVSTPPTGWLRRLLDWLRIFFTT